MEDNEQFTKQLNTNDTTQFDFEKTLRGDRDSLDNVRKLSPTRYRFRVVDSSGQDIRGKQIVSINSKQHVETESVSSEYKTPTKEFDSTRVSYVESDSDHNHHSIRCKHHVSGENKFNYSPKNVTAKPYSTFIAEPPGRYTRARIH